MIQQPLLRTHASQRPSAQTAAHVVMHRSWQELLTLLADSVCCVVSAWITVNKLEREASLGEGAAICVQAVVGL